MRGDGSHDVEVKVTAELLEQKLGRPDAAVACDCDAQPGLAIVLALYRGADVERDVAGLQIRELASGEAAQDRVSPAHGIDDALVLGNRAADHRRVRILDGHGPHRGLEVACEHLEQVEVAVEVLAKLLGYPRDELAGHELDEGRVVLVRLLAQVLHAGEEA